MVEHYVVERPSSDGPIRRAGNRVLRTAGPLRLLRGVAPIISGCVDEVQNTGRPTSSRSLASASKTSARVAAGAAKCHTFGWSSPSILETAHHVVRLRGVLTSSGKFRPVYCQAPSGCLPF